MTEALPPLLKLISGLGIVIGALISGFFTWRSWCAQKYIASAQQSIERERLDSDKKRLVLDEHAGTWEQMKDVIKEQRDQLKECHAALDASHAALDALKCEMTAKYDKLEAECKARDAAQTKRITAQGKEIRTLKRDRDKALSVASTLQKNYDDLQVKYDGISIAYSEYERIRGEVLAIHANDARDRIQREETTGAPDCGDLPVEQPKRSRKPRSPQ